MMLCLKDLSRDYYGIGEKVNPGLSSVSPQFFAWVFGLGSAITITQPENVVKQMKDMLSDISRKYE